MSLKNQRIEKICIPMPLVQKIGVIYEHKGKQALYFEQPPGVLRRFKESVIFESTKASNSLEGIKIPDYRLSALIREQSLPQTTWEAEIAGYRDVIALIQESYKDIPVKASVLLQLHRDIYRYSRRQGGFWKTGDNAIVETLPDGNNLIRFQPVPAFQTSSAVDELMLHYNEYALNNEIEPLILVAATVLDFLCIHPFTDGNGRLSRLLTQLLLCQHGFLVGQLVSLEKIIEETKDAYYQALYESSKGWHEGKHDLLPWIGYFVDTILAAYVELASKLKVNN